MNKNNTFILTFILLLGHSLFVLGQDNSTELWQNINNQENANFQNNAPISNAQYFELDNIKMALRLSQATKSVQTTVDIPMPDGTFQMYK